MTHEEAILAGHAVVVSDAWLDEHADAPWMTSIRPITADSAVCETPG